jgi:RNA polymerase sigma factor (sigma-70 family)
MGTVTDRPENGEQQDVAALVARAASGDHEAWDGLVRRYSGLLYAVCRRYRLSPEDTADAVQTVWLRLLEHLHDLRDPERVSSWLATTASRESLRLVARRRTTPVGLPSDADSLFASPDSSDGLDAMVSASDEAESMLRSLTERQRQVVSRLALGFSPKEIAEELMISESTARSLLRHARRSVVGRSLQESIGRDIG